MKVSGQYVPSHFHILLQSHKISQRYQMCYEKNHFAFNKNTREGDREVRMTHRTGLALEMSAKAGSTFMEGQVCLFSSNRQWECSNQSPVSPNHARPETSRTWQTCWNSQNRHYSRNVGQCGCVRHSSVRLHALVLINTHSLSVGTDELLPSHETPIHFSFLNVQCFFLSVTFIQSSIKGGLHRLYTSKSVYRYWGVVIVALYEKRCSL